MAEWNIVEKYDWTSAPRGSQFRKDAPAVWVKSYKLKSNQIMQMINGYINIASGSSGDANSFYEKMYSDAVDSDQGHNFKFPFFGDNVRSFTNTFGDTFQDGFGGSGGIGSALNESVKGLAGPLAQLANLGNPGTYIETPMFYQFEKNDAPLEVSFVLSNTINSDSIDDNQKFIDTFTEINRPLRKDSIAVDPPSIYRVRVPGHRLIRWAYCSNLSVNFLGTRRMINNVIVPEGYQITMSFTSLTLEHAGFMKMTKKE